MVVANQLRAFCGHLPHIQFSKDGRGLVSGDAMGYRFIDVATMQLTAQRGAGREGTLGGLLSPDGRYFAAGSHDVVELFDVRDEKMVAELPGHPSSMRRGGWGFSHRFISFSADRRRMATTEGQRLRIWKTTNGMMVREWSAPGPFFNSTPTLGPDGRFILIAVGAEGFGWFDVETGVSTRTFEHKWPTQIFYERVWLSRNGKRLVAQYLTYPQNAPPESGLMGWDGPG